MKCLKWNIFFLQWIIIWINLFLIKRNFRNSVFLMCIQFQICLLHNFPIELQQWRCWKELLLQERVMFLSHHVYFLVAGWHVRDLFCYRVVSTFLDGSLLILAGSNCSNERFRSERRFWQSKKYRVFTLQVMQLNSFQNIFSKNEAKSQNKLQRLPYHVALFPHFNHEPQLQHRNIINSPQMSAHKTIPRFQQPINFSPGPQSP